VAAHKKLRAATVVVTRLPAAGKVFQRRFHQCDPMSPDPRSDRLPLRILPIV
jgi:hypothetical protein